MVDRPVSRAVFAFSPPTRSFHACSPRLPAPLLLREPRRGPRTARPARPPAALVRVVPLLRPRRHHPRPQPHRGLHRHAAPRARVRPGRRGPAAPAQALGRRVPGQGPDLLGTHLRAGPLRERHHRRDQGADRLPGRLPDDDRHRHVRRQRHGAGRRLPAHPLRGRHLPGRRALPPAQPGQASAGQGHHPSLSRRVARARRRAQAGQGRHRRRPGVPQAPPQPVRAAARPRLRRGEPPRLPRRLRARVPLPRGPVGEGARPRPHPGRGPGRDRPPGPPGRARQPRSRPQLPGGRLLQPAPLRPGAGRPAQARPQARPRGRPRSWSGSGSPAPSGRRRAGRP